ncbi:MAG: hypothetical protein M5U08_19380 [Burkholderiales bacterium]|nr:hypothetical protein [Burkholderiales bacterium]
MRAKRRTSRKAKPKPFWERGYRSHGYWQGRENLGRVSLAPPGDGELRYHWQAGKRAGRAATLREAKLAVEHAVLFGTRQLGLFGEE